MSWPRQKQLGRQMLEDADRMSERAAAQRQADQAAGEEAAQRAEDETLTPHRTLTSVEAFASDHRFWQEFEATFGTATMPRRGPLAGSEGRYVNATGVNLGQVY